MLFFLKNKNRKLKKDKGFTLIETLVAASILAVTLTALMNVMAQNVFNASYTKNKTVATLLAQEGIELVRNIQDDFLLNNTFTGGNFGSFLIMDSALSPCLTGNDCIIDPLDLSVVACGGECPNLRYGGGDGFYSYQESDTETVFKRNIRLEPVEQAVLVEVEVFWSQGQSEFSIDYQMYLFPWI
jgi:prepilin-type N-terminal cleavage/methylation domain-containing protein